MNWGNLIMQNRDDYLPSFLFLMAMSLLLFVAPDLALAAGDDSWIEPGVEAGGNLEAGLVTFGAVIVGIGVIIAGIWASLTGHIDWKKLAGCIVGGVLIMAGPAIVRGLINLSKSGT